MDLTTAAGFEPFRPTPRARVPWSQVGVLASAGVGFVLALAGAAILSGAWAAIGGAPVRATRGLDVLALGFLVAAGPFAFTRWIERKRLLALERRLPDFLTDVASLHKAGLTLHDSLVSAAQGSYGPLDPIVRQAADQVKWNVPVLDVLEGVQRRIGTPIADRIMTVILEAGRTGGNVPEVLEVAADNARATLELREQRHRSMAVYTVITYVASVIFIGVCLAMQSVFVPRMIAAFEGGAGGSLGLKTLPSADAFRSLFFTAALVQAVGNGLVGGVMSDGRVVAGLRHAWIMVVLALIGFALTA